MHDELTSLKKGWRRSMRTGAWYRKGDGWLAVVSGNDGGYTLVLNKAARTFEDALAEANEILTGTECATKPKSPLQGARVSRIGGE